MADETYYSLLEISETASAAEIKTAYLRLIREVHPDRLANAPAYWQRLAEEKSKEINEAYSVLSNRGKRHLYDAQLDVYRGSRNTTTGQTTSEPPTSPPASPTQQRSQTSSRSQHSSGASTGSAQAPRSNSQQHQAASTSAPPTTVASSPSNQPSTYRLNAGQQLFLAVLCGLYGVGAGYGFLTEATTEVQILLFLLSMLFSLLFALIYRERIRSIFIAVGLSRVKHHVLASVGAIALALFAGKIANISRDTHFRDRDDHSASNAQMSQVKIINGFLSDMTVSGHSKEPLRRCVIL
jgi:DnaJ domain